MTSSNFQEMKLEFISFQNIIQMQSERIQTTTKQRIKKLQTERALEVKRDGVRLNYVRTQSQECIYFSFDEDDLPRVNALVQQQRYGLQICQQNGNAVINLSLNQLFDVNVQTLIVWKPSYLVKLAQLRPYYLMKQNASNSIHKSMLSNHTNNPIADYIEQKVDSIPPPSSILRFSYQQDLNQRQNQALKKVGENRLTFIKGPPGCGKTKTIGRLCKLLYLQGKKIVVGTVSNTGNLSILKQVIKQLLPSQSLEWVEKFMYNIYIEPNTWVALQDEKNYIKPKILLLTGLQKAQENAQFQPLLRYFSLNIWIIRKMFEINLNGDMDLIQLYSYLDLIANNNRIPDKIVRKVFSLYKQAVKKIVSQADIIITTTVLSASIHSKTGDQPPFRPDVAILDQASQATWGDTYCYLMFPIQRLVLVGDDKQLNPTVISQDELLKQAVFTTMYYRSPQYSVMLNTQYRMHPRISYFPNYFFYENQLIDGVTEHEKSNNITYFCHHPLSFVNHSIPEQFELDEKGKKNYYNEQQIKIIENFIALFPVQELKNVGIISPYSLQVQKLNQKFANHVFHGLTIKSCDGYQGGEKDFIIFSCVRSNEQRKIGFCGQGSRINVSLTRAKKALLIIGNSVTLSLCSQLQLTQNIWHYLIQFLYNSKLIFQEKEVISYLTEYQKTHQEFINHQFLNSQVSHPDINYEHNQSNHQYLYQFQGQNYLHMNYSQYEGYRLQGLQNEKKDIQKQKVMKQKQQDKVQKLIGMLQGISQKQNQEFEKKNKKILKQIRKYLQNAAKKEEKPSSEHFKQYLGQKIFEFYSAYDQILDAANLKIKLQTLSLLRNLRSQAKKQSLVLFLSCLKQALEFKQHSNHLKLMQICLEIVQKFLIYYLIELYL